MMKKRILSAAVAATVTLFATAGFAADKQTVLTNVQAPVMINQGESYIEAQEGMQLYQGDQLMVLKGGSAQVQYANGCVESVGANAVSRVGSAEACETLATAGTYNQAGGSTGGGGGGMTGLDYAGLAVIGGTAGFIGYKAADSGSGGGNNDRPPVSP